MVPKQIFNGQIYKDIFTITPLMTKSDLRFGDLQDMDYCKEMDRLPVFEAKKTVRLDLNPESNGEFTSATIQGLMSSYGRVLAIRRSSQYAFVDFSSSVEAETAIRGINHKKPFGIKAILARERIQREKFNIDTSLPLKKFNTFNSINVTNNSPPPQAEMNECYNCNRLTAEECNTCGTPFCDVACMRDKAIIHMSFCDKIKRSPGVRKSTSQSTSPSPKQIFNDMPSRFVPREVLGQNVPAARNNRPPLNVPTFENSRFNVGSAAPNARGAPGRPNRDNVDRHPASGDTRGSASLPANAETSRTGDLLTVLIIYRDDKLCWAIEGKNQLSWLKILEILKESGLKTEQAMVPSIGALCAAFYMNEWTRARIMSLDPLTLFYFDYGNTENCHDNKEVSHSRLRELPSSVNLDLFPEMTFPMRFKNGAPSENNNSYTIRVLAEEEGVKVVETVQSPKNSERENRQPQGRPNDCLDAQRGDSQSQNVKSDVSRRDHAGPRGNPPNRQSGGDNPPSRQNGDSDSRQRGNPPKRQSGGDNPPSRQNGDSDSRQRGNPPNRQSGGDNPPSRRNGDSDSRQRGNPPNRQSGGDNPPSRQNSDSESRQRGNPPNRQSGGDNPPSRQNSDSDSRQRGNPPKHADCAAPNDKQVPSLKNRSPFPKGAQVVIEHLVAHNEVYISDLREALKYDKMENDLNSLCSKAELLKELPVDILVAGKFENTFYRAKVLGYKGGKGHLQFIDYGNEEMTELSDIRPLTQEMMVLPAAAWKVTLRGIGANSVSFKKTLSKYCDAKTNFTLVYEDLSRGVDLVPLGEKKSINDMFVESNRIPREAVDYDNTNGTDTITHYLLKEGKQELVKLYATPDVTKDGLVFLAMHNDYTKEVIAEMADSMAEVYALVPDPYKPLLGEMCAAFDTEEDAWCRAICLNYIDKESIYIQFVDYGNKTKISTLYVRRLALELKLKPTVAVMCRIKGVLESKASAKDLETAIEAFTVGTGFVRRLAGKEPLSEPCFEVEVYQLHETLGKN